MAHSTTTPRATAGEARAAGLLQELKVTGHLMSLPAGLFSILHEPAPGAGTLPGIRVSLPPEPSPHVEIAGFRPDGWLAAGDAALVRVRQGAAQILVTIYQQAASEAAPKLQVRQLLGEAQAPQPPEPRAEKFDLMAHVQGSGDIGARFGAWIGEPGSGSWIEGFALAPLEGFPPADLSYQAVLGRGWLSPWVEAGQYCGSRGMALPLLGLRIRLQGAAAEAFELAASASFTDGSDCGPVGSDETCEGEKLAPLEAMMVTLTPRPKARSRPRRQP